jgi:hypothetical protein
MTFDQLRIRLCELLAHVTELLTALAEILPTAAPTQGCRDPADPSKPQECVPDNLWLDDPQPRLRESATGFPLHAVNIAQVVACY